MCVLVLAVSALPAEPALRPILSFLNDLIYGDYELSQEAVTLNVMENASPFFCYSLFSERVCSSVHHNMSTFCVTPSVNEEPLFLRLCLPGSLVGNI